MSNLLLHYSNKLKSLKQSIDPQAIQILKRLKESGFEAYLVGGGVRDLLVDIKPKDFDIATSALPNEVKRKVSHCFIIGRRFKLVHAKRGENIFEIATFRREGSQEEMEQAQQSEKQHLEENFFGTLQEDSFRRDFTVNSLFYDPLEEKIVDHCNGLTDIQLMMIRMIGSPEKRLIEDPVRSLRAIRLSQKLNFSIEPELRFYIKNLSHELKRTALPRRREEWAKFLRLPRPDLAFMDLFDHGIFNSVLPTFHTLFESDDKREEFLVHLRNIPKFGYKLNDPIELFSSLLNAFIQVAYPEGVDPDKLSEDELFNRFCRDELGLFKAELGVFYQALQFKTALKKRESYLKKGERRRKAILTHQTFGLSLMLGLQSMDLTPQEYIFWMEEIKNL